MVCGRKQVPAEPGSCFHGYGGWSQLTRGRSSQQGLPRPASWGSPRSFGPGARSFGSGRKGLTAVPPPSFTGALKSLVPQLWAPRAPAAAPARSRTLTAAPPPTCTRTQDRVGLHARSELLRVSRHERRTRPRNAGWSPPRGESQTATVVRMSIPPLSWLSGVTLTPPSTYKVTNNSDPQCHTDTGYTCCVIAEIPVQLSPANRDRVTRSHSHLNLEVELRSTSAM